MIAVRWKDADALGHVNHAVIVTYLEEARDAILMPILKQPMSYVVARIEVDYRAELRLDQRQVHVVIDVEDIGNTSITLLERVTDSRGVLIAEARTIVVHWNPKCRRGVPIRGKCRRELMTLALATRRDS